MKKKYENKKGMTLFISIVVMSILLLVSFAVINITLKATLFASSGKASQYAFFAADAGIECAIYWDSKFEPSKFDVSANGSPINCGGHSISTGQNFFGTIVRIGGLEAAAELNTSIFGFVMDGGLVENQVSHCAIVEVTKNADGSTNIYSRGYNTCDASHPRRVERGVEVTY